MSAVLVYCKWTLNQDDDDDDDDTRRSMVSFISFTKISIQLPISKNLFHKIHPKRIIYSIHAIGLLINF